MATKKTKIIEVKEATNKKADLLDISKVKSLLISNKSREEDVLSSIKETVWESIEYAARVLGINFTYTVFSGFTPTLNQILLVKEYFFSEGFDVELVRYKNSDSGYRLIISWED